MHIIYSVAYALSRIGPQNPLQEEMVGEIAQIIADYMAKRLKNLKTKRELQNI